MTIKTVRDLIPRFREVKLWLYANDSTKEKPATVLVRGIDGYEIEAIYPQYLDCEVVDFDMGEDGLNIFIESSVSELQFVDTRKNAILGIGDDCGFDEYDLAENGVANTYQVTANELIEMLEAAQNGFTLESLQSDDNIMSVELSNGKTKLEYNFVR